MRTGGESEVKKTAKSFLKGSLSAASETREFGATTLLDGEGKEGRGDRDSETSASYR